MLLPEEPRVSRLLFIPVVLALVALGACRSVEPREKGRAVRVRLEEGVLASAQEGERHALLIGISAYTDPAWNALRYAAKDADDLGRVLADPARGGFRSVTVLTRPEQTTRTSVLAALQALEARPWRPQDTVVVYVSGHGSLARDVRGELQRYLVTSDTRYRDVAGTGLDMATLEQSLERLGSRRRVLVLATCHSGTGKSLLPPEVRDELAHTKASFLPQPLEAASRASLVLSASDWGEAAREDDALANDIYTHFLIQALDGSGDRNRDGAVSATEAHDWARRNTWAYTEGRQRPSAQILEVGADPVLLSGSLQRPGQPEVFSYSARLEGFTLKVDGRDAGELPGGVVVPEGRRKLELRKGGQVLWEDTVALRSGERRELEAFLRPRADGPRRTVTLGGGVLGFLDGQSREQVLPASAQAGVGLGWEGVLLDGKLDLWVDVAAGQGSQSLRLDPGGDVPVRHRTLLVGVALGPTWTWGRLGFSTGPRVAGLWLQRSFQLELLDRDERYVTAWPGWMAAVSFRFTPAWVVEARTQLLWAYVPVDGQTRTVGFGGLMLAGGYRF
ncbi:caspase family protein [Corallococcus sp. AS-1-12]|uniref:caspase family protein n=1 Tax=Corallococcus sp. AS-1-12 TaxID=2874598 RepID=UPI001CBB98CD|nr:caspase family protein [Corallococcus sp. AS-1-12]MBZ4329954.1 caspase family protein [Corallococcus sp. AS-1-12]